MIYDLNQQYVVQRHLQCIKCWTVESEDVLERIKYVKTTAECQGYCQENQGRHFFPGVYAGISLIRGGGGWAPLPPMASEFFSIFLCFLNKWVGENLKRLYT